MQTPDGRYWFNRGFLLINEEGSVFALVEFTMEITRQKKIEEATEKLQEQFYQSQKMESIGRLAGGIAHDLNNLLSPILGYGEMVLDDTPEEDFRRQPVEAILSAGKRAQALVRQLLAFSRNNPFSSSRSISTAS